MKINANIFISLFFAFISSLFFGVLITKKKKKKGKKVQNSIDIVWRDEGEQKEVKSYFQTLEEKKMGKVKIHFTSEKDFIKSYILENLNLKENEDDDRSLNEKNIDRFFYQPFFDFQNSRMEGACYFGHYILGPCKLLHGRDGVHGGASFAFCIELGQVFSQLLSARSSDDVIDLQKRKDRSFCLIEDFILDYREVIPPKTFKKFRLFLNKEEEEEEENDEFLHFVVEIYDLRDDKRVYVHGEGKFMKPRLDTPSKRPDFSQNQVELYGRDYPSMKKDMLSKEACQAIMKIQKDEEYEEREFLVYDEPNPTVIKKLHLVQNYFLLTKGHHFIGNMSEFLKKKFFWVKAFFVKKEEEKEGAKKGMVCFVNFGDFTEDEKNGKFVHQGSIGSAADFLCALVNYNYVPRTHYMFTKNLRVEYMKNEFLKEGGMGGGFKKCEIMRSEFSLKVSHSKMVKGKNRIYSVVKGTLTDLDGKKCFAIMTANFVAIER